MDGSEETTPTGLPDGSSSDELYANPQNSANELDVNSEANNIENNVVQVQVPGGSIGISMEHSQSHTEYVLCNEGVDNESKLGQYVNETDVDNGAPPDAIEEEIVDDNEKQEQVAFDQNTESTNDLQENSSEMAGKFTDVSGKAQASTVYIFTCPFCMVRFKEAEELKTHLKMHMEVKSQKVDAQEQKDKKYQCGECEKAFDDYDLLETHLQEHKPKPEDDKLFRCSFCGKGFCKRSALTIHLNVHKLDKYRCMVCKKYFMNEESLQNHSLVHTSMKGQIGSEVPGRYHETTAKSEEVLVSGVNSLPGKGKHKCSYCEKTFKKKAKLTIHVRIHTGEKPFTCKFCPKAFTQKHTLTSHERIHSGEKPYKCKTCGKSFAHTSSYKQHVRIHTGQRPYSCLHCGKKFITSTSLRVHQYRHSDTRNHKCELCPKAFKTKRHLNQHMKKTHMSKNRYECGKCGETFSTKTRLASHEFMHESKCGEESEMAEEQHDHSSEMTNKALIRESTQDEDGMEENSGSVHQAIAPKDNPCDGKRTLKCAYCMKSFTKPSLLMRHQRIHTGEKPYTCEFCPKAFARKDGLILHERLHTGERPYACKECGKSYRGLTSLKDHEKSHLSCSVCRKKFKSRSAAEEHESTHNVAFQCSECFRPFKTRRLLNCHIKTHEDQKDEFICVECGEVFDTKPLLEAHTLSHDVIQSRQILNIASEYEIKGNQENTSDCSPSDKGQSLHEERLSNNSEQVSKCVDLGNSNDFAEQDGQFIKASDEENTKPDGKDISRQQCRYCKKLFDTTDQLKEHERGHVRTKGKKSHMCGFCGKTFEKECRRITHERIHTGEKPFKCSLCPRTFARKDGLKVHESTHSDSMPFSCDLCSKKFKLKANLNSHLKNAHSEDTLYPCQECDKSFKRSCSLRKHQLIHTSSIVCSGSLKVYICQYCQHSFRRLKPFAQHLKKHDKIEVSRMDSDSVESEKMDDIEKDEKEEDYKPEDDEEKDYEPEGDEETDYNPEDDLDAQGSDISEDIGTMYQCNHCDVKKRNVQSLELHERSHTDERPHACQKCSKRFVREDALQLHESRHLKTQPNKGVSYDVCDRTFRSESSLRFHKKSHVKKMLTCQACGEKFPNGLALREHKKMHSIDLLRNYYCTECPKSFGHKKSLADHVETCHRNSNRVKCEHCGETFVNEGWFRKHMFISHHEILVAEQHLRSHGLQGFETINVQLQPSEQSDPEHNPEKGNFESLHLQSTVDSIETLAAFSSLQSEALAEVANKSDMHHGSDIETCEIKVNCNDEPKKPSSNYVDDAQCAVADSEQNIKVVVGGPGQDESESNSKPSTTEKSLEITEVMQVELPLVKEQASSAERKMEEPDEKVFTCTWCGRSYKKPSQLKIHERSHTDERPYLCNQCGKAFKIAAALKAHEERHSGVKKYKCTECPKGYASASALQEHLDAHRGIKRYQCAECPKSFRQHQSLKEHLDVHRGFRKYQCDDCPRSFSQRRSWRMHMRTHGKIV